ncbi:MAG TPA: SDR family NAD(P)-dependent oxidoreductase, partial [Chthoniobacterales bacterium]
GAFGNVGQSDYAYASAFLDRFADARERRRSDGQRRGKTLSIGWPLWREGGMSIPGGEAETRLAEFGIHPLPTQAGVALLETALRSREPHLVALWGARKRMEQMLLRGPAAEADEHPSDIHQRDPELSEKIESYLKAQFAEVTQLPLSALDSNQRFEEFGLDSIVVGDFNHRLEKGVGPLPKTLLFEFSNFRQLTRHLLTAYRPRWATFFAGHTAPPPTDLQPPAASEWQTLQPINRSDRSDESDGSGDGIAIIGMAGRYPKANDLRTFWKVLKTGRDCVTEIPAERWDIDRYFDPDPAKALEGKMYSRWGAFVDDADKFDPLFFNIAPVEAELMDPQERLFLETAWLVLEDAGYTRRGLQQWLEERYAANVGVFVGITTNTYPAVARDQSAERTVPTSLPWSLANRISYLFNFNGPSLSVDTACSSSLVALHLACEAIRRGECQQAIVGGVNLYLHPSKYVHLCLNQMLSKQGQCRAFGEGGDGFVPGEGVGAVLLKPLPLAQADGDHIYGVIKGTAVNHGGRTNGYTVPNPAAQANLVEQALRRARIEARTVSCIEAHGTGTALGDPVEVAGLAKAFATEAHEVVPAGWCALGSVKSNIGHLEAAAGIAGLTKVLLQLKHRQLAPSLHAGKINPNIELAGTPFRLQRELTEWKPLSLEGVPCPLRAGISSFGAGGANAHVVVEEFKTAVGDHNLWVETGRPVLIVLSARNADRLRAVARNLAEFLTEEVSTPLALVAYTLQIGREALEERVAFQTVDRPDLIAKLGRIAAGDLQGFAHGRTKRESLPAREDGISEALPASTVAADDLEACARKWVSGHAVAWKHHWPEPAAMRRVNLPGYPFNRERYWVPLGSPENNDSIEKPVLHPLLHRDESTGMTRKYVSAFTGHEPVLADHRVDGEAVLPAAATLELALQAAVRSRPAPDLRLRQIVWLRPLIAGKKGLSLEMQLRTLEGDRFEFEIRSGGEAHVQGQIAGTDGPPSREWVELATVRERCLDVVSPEELYAAFRAGGLQYGPAFRAIKEIRSGETEALSRLEVPEVWKSDRYRLHPALVDGALQSLAVFDAKHSSVALPFTLEECGCEEPLGAICYAHVRVEEDDRGSRRYHVKLLGENGLVMARLTGLSVRRLDAAGPRAALYQPVWTSAPPRPAAAVPDRLLLLDEGTDLAAVLEQRAVPFVRVVPGNRYARQDGVVTIRCGEQADYERLVEETEFNGVVHRWSGFLSSEVLQRGIYSVHRLTQALLRCGKHVPFLYAYPLGVPAYEAVAGYARCLRLEHPNSRLKVVGIDQLPGDLLAEMAADDPEVRFRQGHREVRRLEPLNEGQAGDPFRPGGVYLITGGAGALGMIFAEYLRRQYDARLVLVGRAERPGSRALERLGNDVVYCPADVSTPAGARRAVQAAKAQFGQLNGILHLAGVLRDGLIRTKGAADFDAVLAPKVLGLQALEEETRDDQLDCLILFSSTAGVLGNAGQSDYGFANACLDACAHQYSANEDNRGKQFGRVLSINWPLWRDGGMNPNEETVRLHEQAFGLSPMPAAAGLKAFRQALASGVPQCTVIFGTPKSPVTQAPVKPAAGAMEPSPVSSADAETARLQLMDDLKKSVAKVLRLEVGVLEADADTSEYGFDSITFTALANDLNAGFDFNLTPAVLFEYPTLQSFADYLWQTHAGKLVARYLPNKAPAAHAPAVPPPEASLSRDMPQKASVTPEVAVTERAPVSEAGAGSTRGHLSSRIPSPGTHEPIAVVGMSGVFPGAPDLNAFWTNLKECRDSITRTPADRWQDVTGSSSPERALDAPWGGYIDGVDKFDPLVFDISPREAELMDPQQRLFLQAVWHTLDDAGYRRADLAGTKTGVFVGVAANDYANLLAVHGVAVEAYSSTGNAHSVLANRVSYFFDLHGPSEAIDTACSSSLVAIHRAIESIMSGSSEMAIAGGVNVLLSPGAFLAFGKAGMLAADGRCKTFDARANGYVRGEGVGAILLKPLSRAQRDGDRIWGVILGSAENHGGRVQSLTVPNPNAQAQLLQDAYVRAGIDPFTIGCIEAHGTGTALGDPLEINGLKKAFGRNTGAVIEPRCAVGSVKTNVGHLETAAGMA